MPDDFDDVMGVVTERIEERYQMPIGDLRRVVVATPEANPEATAVVYWYSLLDEAQRTLDTAEDALVEALGIEPGELDDPVMELASQVDAAVTARDGRAVVVNCYLGSRTPDARAPITASVAARRTPALQTSPPVPPAARSVAARGLTR